MKKGELSGGDFLSNWHETEPGLAWYAVDAPRTGTYEFWLRSAFNPSPMPNCAYKINNDADWSDVDLTHGMEGNTNIAEDGKVDLRFIAWIKVGSVKLNKGANSVRLRLDSKNNNHGAVDCFVIQLPSCSCTSWHPPTRPAQGRHRQGRPLRPRLVRLRPRRRPLFEVEPHRPPFLE